MNCTGYVGNPILRQCLSSCPDTLRKSTKRGSGQWVCRPRYEPKILRKRSRSEWTRRGISSQGTQEMPSDEIVREEALSRQQVNTWGDLCDAISWVLHKVFLLFLSFSYNFFFSTWLILNGVGSMNGREGINNHSPRDLFREDEKPNTTEGQLSRHRPALLAYSSSHEMCHKRFDVT